MQVTIHWTDHTLTGWSSVLGWWTRHKHGLPLVHVAVQVGDVVLDSCPKHGSRFVPADRWLRAAKPYQSIDLGEVDGFSPSGCSDLEGLPIRPWLMALADLFGVRTNSCMTVSEQLLRRLGYSPPVCRHPLNLLDWSLSR